MKKALLLFFIGFMLPTHLNAYQTPSWFKKYSPWYEKHKAQLRKAGIAAGTAAGAATLGTGAYYGGKALSRKLYPFQRGDLVQKLDGSTEIYRVVTSTHGEREPLVGIVPMNQPDEKIDASNWVSASRLTLLKKFSL